MLFKIKPLPASMSEEEKFRIRQIELVWAMWNFIEEMEPTESASKSFRSNLDYLTDVEIQQVKHTLLKEPELYQFGWLDLQAKFPIRARRDIKII